MLTPEQQKQVESLLPNADKIASRAGVDSGVAYLALCEAVLRHDASKGDLENFAASWISKACQSDLRDEKRLRGKPRRKKKSKPPEEDNDEPTYSAERKPGETREESERRIAREIRDTDEPVPRPAYIDGSPDRELLEALPDYLYEVASMYWVGQFTKGEIAESTGLDKHVVADRLKLALRYIRKVFR